MIRSRAELGGNEAKEKKIGCARLGNVKGHTGADVAW
jgi:hypothetical protein